jgi:hypothetical protein
MPIERLPSSVQLLLAELLDLELGAATGMAGLGAASGAFVSKVVKGSTYWYFQRVEGERTRQHYLGADTPELRRWMDLLRVARAEREPDLALRRRLYAMLAAGGALVESGALVRVLELLAEAGVFRLGGVLVGTLAFRAIANVLGLRVAGAHLRTDDVDVAHSPQVAVALAVDGAGQNVGASLARAEPPLLPVPGLDPRRPSTTFKVRGRELRVDFLTPGPWRENGEPRLVPGLGCAALPLPFLDYLLDATMPAVVFGPRGVLLSVPVPARFALHKLFCAAARQPAFQAKAAKDLRQAAALLEILTEDRPGDLIEAWRALDRRRRARAKVVASAKRLEAGLQVSLRELLPGLSEAT